MRFILCNTIDSSESHGWRCGRRASPDHREEPFTDGFTLPVGGMSLLQSGGYLVLNGIKLKLDACCSLTIKRLLVLCSKLG